jgi:hypothetical protein
MLPTGLFNALKGSCAAAPPRRTDLKSHVDADGVVMHGMPLVPGRLCWLVSLLRRNAGHAVVEGQACSCRQMALESKFFLRYAEEVPTGTFDGKPSHVFSKFRHDVPDARRGRLRTEVRGKTSCKKRTEIGLCGR